MAVEIKNSDRVRLTGKNIEASFSDIRGKLYTYLLSIDRYLGEGASCICYEVTVRKSSDTVGQKRVLKQFYPSPVEYEIDASMSGMTLDIAGYDEDMSVTHCPEVTELGQKFETAFRRQALLSNREELSGVIVRPDLCYFSGSTKYILYEPDFGTTLSFDSIDSAELLVDRMLGLATALMRLHSQRFIYMDLKPENVLVSSDGRVKVFDFDALIDLDDLENVHLRNGDVRYDTTDIRLIAPEIRPENLINFEVDKRYILTERTDIYSFGAILLSYFLNRYPTEEDTQSAAFASEIRELFVRGRRRGELTAAEQDMLCEIIWKCIQKNIGPRGRYRNSEILVEELSDFAEKISEPLARRRRFYNRIDGQLVAAQVLYKAPLCDYITQAAAGPVMDCAIIGDDRVCEDFLAAILSSAYVTDTRLVIRRFGSNLRKRMDGLLEKWPLLKKTTDLYYEDEKIEGSYLGLEVGIDKRITDDPFAEIRFYENADVNTLAGLNSSWIVLSDAKGVMVSDCAGLNCGAGETAGIGDGTAELVGSDFDRMMAHKLAAQGSGAKKFIAYLSDRGDGFELRESEICEGDVKLLAFSVNSKRTLEEKQFEKGLNRRALMLHRFYATQWNERMTRSELWADFSGGEYNISSSVCGVLSIPYKLRSINISEDGAEAAARFRSLIIESERWNPGSEMGPGSHGSKECSEQFYELMYLEHRRWMGFMLTQGYDRPEEFESYAYKGSSDRRDKRRKLHPCICSCSKGGNVPDGLSNTDWDNYDVEKNTRGLDMLDLFSVSFHQFCDRKVRDMVEQEVFEDAFDVLERSIKAERCDGETVASFAALKSVHTALLAGVTNMNHRWNRACSDLKLACQREAEKRGLVTAEILEALEEICDITRIVEERNLYHNYKNSDRTMLEAVPLLLDSDEGIRRVYKVASGDTWSDVVCSVLLEPEEVVLFTDNGSDADRLREFLCEKRGLGVKNVSVLPVSEISSLRITARSKKSVLDVTGADEKYIKKLRAQDNLKALPFIFFSGGELKCDDRTSVAAHGNVVRRHLSVGEALWLEGMESADESQTLMLGAVADYRKIWEAYCRLGRERYSAIVASLAEGEARNRLVITRDEPGPESLFLRKNIPEAMMASTGIKRVCEALAENGYIASDYRLPKLGKIGEVQISTSNRSVAGCLTEMFDRAISQPYRHEFRFVKEQGRDYIADDTLVMDCIMSREDADLLAEYFGDALSIEAMSADGRVSGSFVSTAARHCLTDMDMLPRTVVYHALWDSQAASDVRVISSQRCNVAADAGTDTDIDAGTDNDTDIACVRDMQLYFVSSRKLVDQVSLNSLSADERLDALSDAIREIIF